MKKSIKSIVVLVSICAVMACLLALTNELTAPIIEERQNAAANAALLEVLPEGGTFEEIEFDAQALPKTVTNVWRASNGGYVIQLTTAGFDTGMILMCGISANGAVVGSKLLASKETPSYGGAQLPIFAPKLVGETAATIDGVDAKCGATISATAYRNAVKDALNAALLLGGQEAVKTPEEILLDNLSAALPAAEGQFEKVFMTEILEGIDAVYAATNKKGYVYVTGEEFVAVDENGQCASASVAAAHALLLADTTQVDLSALEERFANVVSVKKTTTGNYVLEIKGAGYGIVKKNEKYSNASGEYIRIQVSMTADGRIIDTKTLYQKESKGIGDVCAEESFYSQFDGMTKSELLALKGTNDKGEEKFELDAISKATYTANGYAKAILLAFETVEALEGGSNE